MLGDTREFNKDRYFRRLERSFVVPAGNAHMYYTWRQSVHVIRKDLKATSDRWRNRALRVSFVNMDVAMPSSSATTYFILSPVLGMRN